MFVVDERVPTENLSLHSLLDLVHLLADAWVTLVQLLLVGKVELRKRLKRCVKLVLK
jgi:hypothetical protein